MFVTQSFLDVILVSTAETTEADDEVQRQNRPSRDVEGLV